MICLSQAARFRRRVVATILATFIASAVTADPVIDGLLELCGDVPENEASFIEAAEMAGWQITDIATDDDVAAQLAESLVLQALAVMTHPPTPGPETAARLDEMYEAEFRHQRQLLSPATDQAGGSSSLFFSKAAAEPIVIWVKGIFGDRVRAGEVPRGFVNCRLYGPESLDLEEHLGAMERQDKSDHRSELWNNRSEMPSFGERMASTDTHTLLELRHYDSAYMTELLGRKPRLQFVFDISTR